MSERLYNSQCGQDIYIDTAYRGMTGGVFFECGAGDGIMLSNTYFLEKHRGWTGVCVEPNRESFAELQKNRTCHLFPHAIGGARRDDVPFWEVTGGTILCSALDDVMDHERLDGYIQNHGGDKRLVPVSMFTAQDVLDKFGIAHVDYMSLDTDGNELDILRGIDWERTFIGTLTVENIDGNKELRRFMDSKNYDLVSHLSWDDVFAHESII